MSQWARSCQITARTRGLLKFFTISLPDAIAVTAQILQNRCSDRGLIHSIFRLCRRRVVHLDVSGDHGSLTGSTAVCGSSGPTSASRHWPEVATKRPHHTIQGEDTRFCVLCNRCCFKGNQEEDQVVDFECGLRSWLNVVRGHKQQLT